MTGCTGGFRGGFTLTHLPLEVSNPAETARGFNKIPYFNQVSVHVSYCQGHYAWETVGISLHNSSEESQQLPSRHVNII